MHETYLGHAYGTWFLFLLKPGVTPEAIRPCRSYDEGVQYEVRRVHNGYQKRQRFWERQGW